MKYINNKKQAGITSVEFAICGMVYFIVLFGVIEVGRYLFTLNILDEVTRRGARLAAVCPPSQSVQIIDEAIMGGNVLPGILSSHVKIEYIDANRISINPATAFSSILYVRVSIDGYSHQLLIPTLMRSMPIPKFSTTTLAESLGVIPPATPADTAGASSC